jgi:hypothetical protein
VNRCSLAVLCVVLSSCHRNRDLDVEMVNARPMEAAAPIARGDCVEARRRAADTPDLAVDRLPNPIKQSPRPFQKMPASVRGQVSKSGAVIKVDVMVDTLGRANMKTFKVVEVSNPWFAQNLRTVMPGWRFSPAELAGCKVSRVYKFSATSQPATR